MDEDDKPKLHAGATMQIDLDQVQLVDLDKGRERSKPPPLPPMPPQEQVSQVSAPAAISASPPRPSAAPAPLPSNAKNLMHVGIIVLVVALAVVAGLAVGRGFGRPAATAPSASAPAPTVSTPAPVVSHTTQTAPSNEVLIIPPVEVK